MRLNSMLATVLIFLCSLVISSCSNDELAPISLKNRETANIKLNYPNNQTYSFPLQRFSEENALKGKNIF